MTVIVHRIDENNPGDYWSSPSHYFPLKVSQTVDIGVINDFKSNEPIIFGGGGLLGRITWDNNVSNLVNNNKVILWGAGQNYYGQKKKGDLIGVSVESKLPDYIDKFHSVGLRDYNLGYNWVPCASCMHPALNAARKIKTTNKILGIQHNKIKIKSPFFQSISHAIKPNELQDFLCYIASFECIVTNTYHGAYWSLLLGKKVVVQPWSSKFNNLKWNFEITSKEGPMHKSIVDIAESVNQNNQTALEEARQANNNFFTSLDL
jgi:hypothetical protein